MRLVDLAAWNRLGAKCSSCGHKAWVDRGQIARRFSHDASLALIGQRLRCTRCRNRTGNDLVVTKVRRD